MTTFAGGPADEAIRMLGALALGATEGLQQRASAWFARLAGEHADHFCDDLAEDMARAEKDEAEDY